MKLHIVMVEPEIPQNTGNIARTCAITGAKLHLVHPLGFKIDEKSVKRAGLDYWDKLDIEEHKSLDDFLNKYRPEENNMFFATTKGTTKYTDAELLQMFEDDQNPVYVAVDEKDQVVGYAFCKLRQQPFSNNMVQFTSLFIDDLCVDTTIRGKHIGQKLFEHVKKEARKMHCYEVTLNVWEGNDSAKAFYEKMGLKPKETQMEYIIKDQGDRYVG